MIDLDGTVRIPAEKDVHWCDVCGITNSDESEIYEQDGTVVGSGGHGLASGTLYYDVNSKKVYAVDMGWLYSWRRYRPAPTSPSSRTRCPSPRRRAPAARTTPTSAPPTPLWT